MKTKEIKQNIYNLIMKNGKKQTSEKLFLKSLKLIKKISKTKNTTHIIKTSIVNSAPLTKIKLVKRNKKRRNKHNITFPYLLTFNQKISTSIKNIISDSQNKKNSKYFFENLFDEIQNTSNKQGKIVEKVSSQHNEAFLKKKFSNYRWF